MRAEIVNTCRTNSTPMPLDAPVTTQTSARVIFDYACTGRELDVLLPRTSAMTVFTKILCALLSCVTICKQCLGNTRAVAALRAAHDGGIGLVIVLSINEYSENILSFRSPGKVNYSEGTVLKLQTKCLK